MSIKASIPYSWQNNRIFGYFLLIEVERALSKQLASFSIKF
jgi:hypothetical protein